ncbi:MAG: T9SS type A sorting domain-containing protein [Ferruginibacter sp.]
MVYKLIILMAIINVGMGTPLFAQQNGDIKGIPIVVNPTKTETTAYIMEKAKNYPVKMIEREEKEYPNRRNLPQNPLSPAIPAYPFSSDNFNPPAINELAQTPSTSFNGVTGPTETGAFPPDDMGAVGPTQYILFVNGRLRSFNKTTGVADGILNVDPDVFFVSVMTPIGGLVTQVFTSDPRIKYDRLSAKWILVIIDVPLGASGNTPVANRVLIAYSNTSTITAATTWTFSQFTGEASKFTDYETLGIDANALYIGTNMFTLAGVFSATNGYVINRNTVLSGAAYTVYTFTGLVATPTGAGPFTPQGVDNFDYSATQGYFIGVDNATFGTLMMRRVSTPAGVPTISANISIIVSTTTFPQTVPHLGNTGGNNGKLDALDDRLFAAVARNGHIWTSHNISVLNTGVAASTGTERRNGVRWYDIQNITATPSISQSGTIYDPALTASNPRWYGVPSVMVSGQNHVAFSMTTGGLNDRANAATTGRLTGDAAGTTQANSLTTASTTAYNPAGDPGGTGGRRWGDYSYVSLDPLDNMTMWMVGQYCSNTNVYGCNVTKLLAPPPATPASTSPASTPAGQLSVNVVVTGTAVSGSGFYDPGTNLSAPALAYSHISATVSGGVTVNSITYTDPTHVTLNLSTAGSPQGMKNITITNPDGQELTGNSIFQVLGVVPITWKELKGKLNSNLTVTLNWITSTESGNKGFFVERTETNDQNGWTSIGFVNGANNSATEKNYSLVDNDIQLSKIYRYRLKQVDFDGNFSYSNEVVIRVNDQKNRLLLTNHPNPFKSIVTIKYNLPTAGVANLKVFDVSGKEVAMLADGYHKAGLYTVEFKPGKLSKGTYICKLVFEGEILTNQMILIK